MRYWDAVRDVRKLISDPVVVAIGCFDGVHQGHRAVIKSARSLAKTYSAKTVIYTFWPYPSELLGRKKPLILTREQKMEQMRLLGVDDVVEQVFDEQFCHIASDDFIRLLKTMFPFLKGICVGDDFRFGFCHQGNAESLKEKATDIKVCIQAPVYCKGERISSTRVRQLLANADVELANHLLGFSYPCSGIITPGRQIARTLGFPTINVLSDIDVLLKEGVYTVRLKSENDNTFKCGISYVSHRFFPDRGDIKLIEVHLLEDFQNNLYGHFQRVTVEFLNFIRPKCEFVDHRQLSEQIGQDIIVAKTQMAHFFK